MPRPMTQAMHAREQADPDGGKAERPHDRPQLGVEVFEIGAGAQIHVESGNSDGVANFADRRLLAGLDIFVRQQDLAISADAIQQFLRQLTAVGHDVHAVGANLLGIGRHLGDAVIARREQIAGAVVIGHGVAELAQHRHRLVLGHFAGIDLPLQLAGHVPGDGDDGLGLVDPRVEHFLLHQITGDARRPRKDRAALRPPECRAWGQWSYCAASRRLRNKNKKSADLNGFIHDSLKFLSAALTMALRAPR